jgi:hypothetical protein
MFILDCIIFQASFISHMHIQPPYEVHMIKNTAYIYQKIRIGAVYVYLHSYQTNAY